MDKDLVQQQLNELMRRDTEAWLAKIPEIIALARKLATQPCEDDNKFDASYCRHCHMKLNEDLPSVKTWLWESPELVAGGYDGVTLTVREGLGVFNIDILEVKGGDCDIDRPLFTIVLRESGWLDRLREAQEAPEAS